MSYVLNRLPKRAIGRVLVEGHGESTFSLIFVDGYDWISMNSIGIVYLEDFNEGLRFFTRLLYMEDFDNA